MDIMDIILARNFTAKDKAALHENLCVLECLSFVRHFLYIAQIFQLPGDASFLDVL